MAAPTTYTEGQLMLYMVAVLGETADVLGWRRADGDYVETVNDVIIDYGVDAIADATDIAKLRALARRAIWKAAVAGLTPRYDFSTDGQSFQRSQMLTHAKEALARAEADALVYGFAGYDVRVDRVLHKNDPYVHLPEEVRTA